MMRFRVTGAIGGQEGNISTRIEANSEAEARQKAKALGYAPDAQMDRLQIPSPRPEGQAVTLDRHTLAELDKIIKKRLETITSAAIVFLVLFTLSVVVAIVAVVAGQG